mmetsp:Transcript_22143/g.37496  ORF Transcript_22143/g.37496 Transcript_22143/m.37496 type:complete len:411 (+) Transcript_22143:55-1287(+)
MIQLLSFACLVAFGTAQLLPGFTTFRADQRNSGVLDLNGTKVGREQWTLQTNVLTGDMIDNSAVIGKNGDLFFAISKILFCVSKEGKVKWKHKSPGLFLQSTASLTEDALYILGSNYDWGSDRDNAIVMSINPSTGQVLWQHTLKYGGIYGSLNILQNGNIVAVFDGYHLVAFSPSGEELWDYKDLGDYNPNSSIEENTPAVADDGSIIYGAKDGVLRSVSSEGDLQWALQITPFHSFTSPSIGEDGNIYISVDEGTGYTYNASVYCVSAEGEVVWHYVALAEYAVRELTSSIYHNGNVYVIMDSYLYSLRDGEMMWRYHFYDPVAGSLTAWNVPVITRNNMMYVGAFFWMYGFDISGTEKATDPPPISFMYKAITYGASTLGWGPIPTVDTDGNVYFGTYSTMNALGGR